MDTFLLINNEEEIKKMLKELCKFGSQKAIMTGVSLQKNSIGAYGYDADNDTYTYYFTEEEKELFEQLKSISKFNPRTAK